VADGDDHFQVDALDLADQVVQLGLAFGLQDRLVEVEEGVSSVGDLGGGGRLGSRCRMTQFAKETLPISLEEEMRRSYLDYAMSVIVGRALPDARDGLKPVHRRVLFAMHELNNDWNRPYKKSRASSAT
jgi:hypothetical protein